MLEQSIKETLEKVTGLKVYPAFGIGKEPFIVYNVTPISGGVVRESQLEVKVIDSDLDRSLDIREKINKEFDMTLCRPSPNVNGTVFRGSLTGGGFLFNDSIQLWETTTLYLIRWRN